MLKVSSSHITPIELQSLFCPFGITISLVLLVLYLQNAVKCIEMWKYMLSRFALLILVVSGDGYIVHFSTPHVTSLSSIVYLHRQVKYG